MKINLALAVSSKFRFAAVNLIESFRKNVSEDGKILFSYFNDGISLDEEYIQALENYYGDYIQFKEVPVVCSHAHQKDFYFFKTYALYRAMQCDEDFVYADAAMEFLLHPKQMMKILNKETRFYLQYPRVDFFMNERWTTRQCFVFSQMDEERYKKSHQYIAGFQAYKKSNENWDFIHHMYDMMLNPLIAGPSNGLPYPAQG